MVLNEILSTNFRFNENIDRDNLESKLNLSEKYDKYLMDILRILKSKMEKKVNIYYGKPFSYYYQIIERRN